MKVVAILLVTLAALVAAEERKGKRGVVGLGYAPAVATPLTTVGYARHAAISPAVAAPAVLGAPAIAAAPAVAAAPLGVAAPLGIGAPLGVGPYVAGSIAGKALLG